MIKEIKYPGYNTDNRETDIKVMLFEKSKSLFFVEIDIIKINITIEVKTMENRLGFILNLTIK